MHPIPFISTGKGFLFDQTLFFSYFALSGLKNHVFEISIALLEAPRVTGGLRPRLTLRMEYRFQRKQDLDNTLF